MLARHRGHAGGVDGLNGEGAEAEHPGRFGRAVDDRRGFEVAQAAGHHSVHLILVLLVDESWVGWTVEKLFVELKSRHEAVLVGLERPSAEADGDGIVVNPSSDTVVQQGDVLLLISANA